jgi:predicted nuclease with TOPRIM domain
MENESKPKGKKPRLKSCKSQLQTSLNDLDTLLASPTLREVSKAGLIQAKLSCLQSLMLMESEERKLKVKHADVDALIKENGRLKAENAELRAELNKKPDVKPNRAESFEERLARLVPSAKKAEEKQNGAL